MINFSGILVILDAIYNRGFVIRRAMKRTAALFIMLITVSSVRAQIGFPLLTHYTESRDVENQSWAICQGEDEVMLFANRRGILTFDGQEWKQAGIRVIPFAMSKDPAGGNIFIGAENDFGFIEKDPYGRYSYTSLAGDSALPGAVTKIIFRDSIIWFYSDRSISRFDRKKNATDLVLNSEPGTAFTGMFTNQKNTFINVSGRGLHRLESDTLFPIVTGYLTEQTEILFSLPYDDKLVLTGLGNGRLSLFDGIKYYDYPVKDEGYLRANILSEGLALGDTAYAFTTLDGGALVVEKRTGKVLYTINNQVGLPDDEIFAAGLDNSGGLWLSHQYGLSRADLLIPVRDYSTYPGLAGNLSSVQTYRNDLYVASSEGVFYLEEVKSYTEVEVLVKKAQPAITEAPAVTQAAEPPAQRRSILSRIFGGRNTREQGQPAAAEQAPVVSTPQPPEYARKTVSTLRSINYVYRKVSGLNEKCRQLVSTPHGLLAATNRGLYVINDRKARLIIPDRYINFISWSQISDSWYIATANGYMKVRFVSGNWMPEVPDPGFMETIYSITAPAGDLIWLGGDNKAFRTKTGSRDQYMEFEVANEFLQRYYVDHAGDTVFLFTESGAFYFDANTGSFMNYLPTSSVRHKPSGNTLLIHDGEDWISPGSTGKLKASELSLLRIFGEIVTVTDIGNNLWIIAANNRLYRIDRTEIPGPGEGIPVMIKNISNDKGVSFDLTNVKLSRGDDIVIFDIVAPSYIRQNSIQYQYFIGKVMDNWSPWSADTHYEKYISRPGDYVLQVRARDIWGNPGEIQSLNLTIKAPFTETLLFYVLLTAFVLALFILIVRFREKQLQETNRVLEQKVKERTAEIEAQKEEITSSIEYASRIQMAMLPVDELFRSVFSDYFIFFRPRDIVSGDFYWIGEDEKTVFFTVADCTGHGVPGAFMSTMGISTLNEIIANNENLNAARVLNLLREKIKTSLHQTGKVGETVDGMDISFCVLEKKQKVLHFAGAFNPLIVVRSGEVIEYKGNSMPIGIHYGIEEPFTNHEIKLVKGDTLYMFSDGFPDQFGGPEGSKYKKSNLKKLFGQIYASSMEEQRSIIEQTFNEWKGQGYQIDDVTIMGIRV
jgi:serine phosphatase RsbU (regulator of sigma subunit)/ligand-binding sensor domain-containing protein